MITARGVLVSSSSSFRLFSPPPSPHRTKRTKECTTSNRIEARDSALRVILSSFAQVLGYASMMHSKTRFPPIIECGSVLSRRGCGRERERGKERSVPFYSSRERGDCIPPFCWSFHARIPINGITDGGGIFNVFRGLENFPGLCPGIVLI